MARNLSIRGNGQGAAGLRWDLRVARNRPSSRKSQLLRSAESGSRSSESLGWRGFPVGDAWRDNLLPCGYHGTVRRYPVAHASARRRLRPCHE